MFSLVLVAPTAWSLYFSQLAFPRHALVRFVHAFYSIFEFAADVRQLFRDFIRTARDIAVDGGVSWTI
jgi:hypothetical protein